MKPTFRFEFEGEQRHTDTVVFVHGLIGDLIDTWGRFPQLIASDPYLPDLDILMCGYRSRFFRWDPDIEGIGRRLTAQLEVQIESDSRIFLVGHSMGGLVILAGVAGACSAGFAQRHPTANVDLITLYATPVFGSQAAAGLKYLMGLLQLFPTRLLTWFFSSRQVAQLARGRFVDELLHEIVSRLCCTPVDAADANAKRFMNVRVVMGNEDIIVCESSARGPFHRLPPLFVTGTHSTCKEPTDHSDARYRALTNDIADSLRSEFSALCRRCWEGEEQAQAIFSARWKRAITYRLEKASRGKPVTLKQRKKFYAVTWRIAANGPTWTPGRAFDAAIMEVAYAEAER